MGSIHRRQHHNTQLRAATTSGVGGSKRSRSATSASPSPTQPPGGAPEADFALWDKAEPATAAAAAECAPGSAPGASIRARQLADALRAEMSGGEASSASDGEGGGGRQRTPHTAVGGGSSQAQAEAYRPIQLIFASRTHSQLSQFVSELRNTAFGAEARVVMLGGRRQLCSYAPVKQLRSDQEITEACLRLRDASKKAARKAVAAAKQAGGSKGGATDIEDTALRLGSAVQDDGTVLSASDALAARMLRQSSLSGASCPCYNAEGMTLLRNHALAEPMDIETLAAKGAEVGVCAYYAARKALPLAEVVCVPYNLLLQATARDALGLNLRGNIVIIDEAHNIVNSVVDTHSVTLQHATIAAAWGQLEAYLTKYRTRLSPHNLVSCSQLRDFAAALLKCVETLHAVAAGGGRTALPYDVQLQDSGPTVFLQQSISSFITWAQCENMHLGQLHAWAVSSGVCNKLRGFVEHARLAAIAGGSSSSTLPPAGAATASHQLVHLLLALSAPDAQGSLFCVGHKPHSGSGSGSEGGGTASPPYLRYTLLNAAAPMQPILQAARAVVFAGGTMKPTHEVTAALMPRLPPAKLRLFSCGHVIPPTALRVLTLPSGPRGYALHFSLKRRGSRDMLLDFGLAMVNISRALPRGMVLFVPSYDFAEQLVGASGVWRQAPSSSTSTNDTAGAALPPPQQQQQHMQTGAEAHAPPGSVLARIQASKHVFVERRRQRTEQGAPGGAQLSLWDAYCKAVQDTAPGHSSSAAVGVRGALLMCVVGGKMSEGINFKDDLARCVVVAGMPYPSPGDPELMARMAFMEELRPGGGREYYHNLCMKAVNQSIGRVIRHAGDYGVVLLADERYGQASVQARLPDWIQPRSTVSSDFKAAFAGAVKALSEQRRRAQQAV